jgi:phosphoglycolate phosphatase
VIFDFDFTLADSSAGAIDCINHALGCLGLPEAPERRILESIGLSLPATLAHVAGVTDSDAVATFTRHFIERADQVMAERTVLYACVPRVVRSLCAAGLTHGIVSSKFRYRIERILKREGIGDCFDVIVGSEDVTAHKPDPTGLLLAIERLGRSAGEVVYVGDHPVDEEAAGHAGVAFVATLTGVCGREGFRNGRSLAIIDDLSALPELLGAMTAPRV